MRFSRIPTSAHREFPSAFRAFFKEYCSNVDIGVSLFNTAASGYSLSAPLVKAIAEDNENLCCIKNAQPKYHCDEVREAVGDDIVVSDPMETQWFFNRAYHKQQTYMSGPDPFLLQRTGNLGMQKYTDLIDEGNLEEAWTRARVHEPDTPRGRQMALGALGQGGIPHRRAQGLDGPDGNARRPLARADDSLEHR